MTPGDIFHLDICGNNEDTVAALKLALQDCQALVICTSAVPEVKCLPTLLGGLRVWLGSILPTLPSNNQLKVGFKLALHSHMSQDVPALSSGLVIATASNACSRCRCDHSDDNQQTWTNGTLGMLRMLWQCSWLLVDEL